MLMPDSDPATHTFNLKTASPALKAAISDLARRSGRQESEFAGMPLGRAYQLACETYGTELPDFWRVWNTWNQASRLPPAPMGDL